MPIFTVGAAGTTSSSAYEIANSLRFNDDSSDNLTRTPSASNRKTYTISTWIKRSTLGNVENIFTSGVSGTEDAGLRFLSGNNISFYEIASPYSAYDFSFETNAIFRDVSAWYHIIVAVDTTQATDSNRVKIYVNGSQITSFASLAYPSQNYDTLINSNNLHRISGAVNTAFGTRYFDGYMSEFVFIDGQQLDPTSFGEFDSATGIWKPIDVSGLTFGTNGFYLDFKSSGSLGNDVSGNGNNFTVNNLTSVDQSTDTPTNIYATLNNLSNTNSNYIFSEGNLKATETGNWLGSVGTMGLQSGKWYWEVLYGSGNFGIGIAKAGTSASETNNLSTANIGYSSKYPDGYEYFKNFSNSNKVNNDSSTSYGSVPSANDIIMVAFDADNGTIWVGKQGTWYGSATQSEIEAGTTTNSMYSGITIDDFFLPTASIENGNLTFNFGSPSYAISSSNSDGNGYGNFEYAVPNGYYAINSKNLAQYG